MSGSNNENARASDSRRSLAEQLAPTRIPGRLSISVDGQIEGVVGRDGKTKEAGSFLALVEEHTTAKPFSPPQPITETPRPLGPWALKRAQSMDRVPAASEVDELAREAAAQIELEDGWALLAELRRKGRSDGDELHRVAVRAINLTREGRA